MIEFEAFDGSKLLQKNETKLSGFSESKFKLRWVTELKEPRNCGSG